MNEQPFWFLLETSTNIFECIIYLVFPTYILGSNSDKIKFIVQFCIAFVIIAFIVGSYEIFGAFQSLLIMLVVSVYSCLTLKGMIVKKISISIIQVFLLSIIVVPTIFLSAMVYNVPVINVFSQTEPRVFAMILTRFLVLIVLILMSLFIKKKGELNKKQWIMISLIFIVAEIANSLINSYAVNVDIPYSYQYIFFYVSTCVLIIAILGFITIAKFSKENQIKSENEILKKEKLFIERNIETIRISNDEIRKLKHDFKNYILVIRGYIEQSNFEKAVEECVQLSNKFDNVITIVECNSKIISLIINEKIMECRGKNIDIKCRIIKDINVVEERDFIIVFNNLVDNAIEYLNNVDNKNKKIELEIFHKNGFIVLKIKNYIEKSILLFNPELNTTKKDKINHGIGHKNIAKILAETGGAIQYSERNNFFIVEALFPKR